MSQYPQHPGVSDQPPCAPSEGYSAYRPASWSAMAVVAFIFSFIFCIPVFPLVGIILAIVGIIATSNQQRRGRGLAIAAIPISLVSILAGGLLWAGGILSGIQVTKSLAATQMLFQADSDELAAAADEMLELTTQDFQDSVSSERLIEWAKSICSKHGKLTNVQFSTDAPPPGTEAVLLLQAKFVNGTAVIRLTLGQSFESLNKLVTIDDIEVAGSSPRDFKPPSKTD